MWTSLTLLQNCCGTHCQNETDSLRRREPATVPHTNSSTMNGQLHPPPGQCTLAMSLIADCTLHYSTGSTYYGVCTSQKFAEQSCHHPHPHRSKAIATHPTKLSFLCAFPSSRSTAARRIPSSFCLQYWNLDGPAPFLMARQISGGSLVVSACGPPLNFRPETLEARARGGLKRRATAVAVLATCCILSPGLRSSAPKQRDRIASGWKGEGPTRLHTAHYSH